MTPSLLKPNALLLYKNKPARLLAPGAKKIEIEVSGSGRLKVRPKDVQMLHPGPVGSLAELRPVEGDVLTAWELLAGETCTLEELADLAYGRFTPETAWAAWQLAADKLYFYGTPDDIQARTEAEVAEIQAARKSKAAKTAVWQAFISRLQSNTIEAEDGRFMQEIAALALEQRPQSKALKALGQAETPENAHALLLKTGYWSEAVNPYPARMGVAARSAEAPIPDLPEEPRRDLTALPAYAIDDAGSTDPDDAISWDGRCLWVHVADVAALVPPDSPADLEARSRGANLYLPEGTVTMLPPAATPLLGLGLQEKSPALSFKMVVSAEGELSDLEIIPSWIRVTRLSYADADTRLDEEPFRTLFALSRLYEARRRQNGAIEIYLPEVRVRVDEEGVVVIRPLPQLRSREMVRDAMLMAGEAIARYAFAHAIPLPYTTQEAPAEPLPPANTPSEFFARRRLMKPSQQSTRPGAHAGLGMGFYAQATSPLRRYLDLVVHQQLRAHVLGEEPLDAQAVMARVGAAALVSRDVRQAERLSNRHWTLVYLLQNPEWTGEGIIIDKRGKKDVVLIPALDLETRIFGKGERPLDSPVRIKLKEVNLPALEAHFQTVK
jgi:exoribonuclease-2